MPTIGLEMRRIAKLSIDEWSTLSQKLDALMVELGYDEKKLLAINHYDNKSGKTRRDWFQFLRNCKPEDFARLSPKIQERENLVGCHWYSLSFEPGGIDSDPFIPQSIIVKLSVGWGPTYERDGEEKERMALERIEMLFLGPFRTYYKCLGKVSGHFRTEAERKEAQENGFALAVLMDPGLRRFVFPVA